MRQVAINGAKHLGMEGKLGELVERSFADLLFLGENSLEDVASLDRTNENVVLIIKHGMENRQEQDSRVEAGEEMRVE